MIIRKRSVYLIVITLVLFIIVHFIYNLFNHHRQFQFHKPPPHVIFPKDFNPSIDKSLFLEESQTIHIGYNSRDSLLGTTTFHLYEFSVFNSKKFVNLDFEQCGLLESKNTISINKPIDMKVSLFKILSKLLYDMKDDEYLKELQPFIIPELLIQLKLNIIDKFWYRFSGSAIWLDQYQVFFMISRIIYSPKGIKNQPVLSLTYAQIYDKNWNEIHGKLVVPSNNLNKQQQQQELFKDLTFPCFLRIPFFHDYDQTLGKYYGPEDPRLILVNVNGYEEPLIIFNSYNRKFIDADDDEDIGLGKEIKFFRSMYMCYPWKFQLDKSNVEGISTQEYNDHIYNKIIEFKIKKYETSFSNQKNWTPFISSSDKSKIKFVYRWTNLDILSCDLTTGFCEFEYKMNKTLSPKNKVGPLRGGTQLVNLNDIIPDKSILLPTREIFVGFARTHLDDCGCGKTMYRPNLVILVKDIIDDQIYYKVSHISPSLSFDIPIPGWSEPDDLCYDLNILIPYSISKWDISSLKKIESNYKVKDELILTLTISDETIHKLNIRGLFQSILNLNDNSLFKIPSSNPKLPSSSKSTDSHLKYLGYNNDNLMCALKGSDEFCFNYGQSFYEKHPNLKNKKKKTKKKPKDRDLSRYVKTLNEYLYNMVFQNR